MVTSLLVELLRLRCDDFALASTKVTYFGSRN